jgi:hypothetical protein
MPRINRFAKVWAAAGLLACAGLASAATITVTPSSETVTVGQTYTIQLGFVPDGATTDFQFRFNYTTEFTDATATAAAVGFVSDTNSCAEDPPPINDGLGRVLPVVIGVGGSISGVGGSPIASIGVFCTVAFQAVAVGVVNFTISLPTFGNGVEPHVLGSATVTIQAAPATGPTLTAPAQTTYSVSGGSIGGFGQTSFQFTATGGNVGQSTPLTCVANAPVQLVSSGNQTVTTGSQPAPVVVRIQLTNAAQSGTVTCNGVVFTINAAAGSAFTPPEVIPSASTWSMIALFGLLGLFGVLAVGFLRS